MLNATAERPNTANSVNEMIVIVKNTIMAPSASIFAKLSIPKQTTVPVKPTIKPVAISTRNILTIIISLTSIVKICPNSYCAKPYQEKEQEVMNESNRVFLLVICKEQEVINEPDHLSPPESHASFGRHNPADKGTLLPERLPKARPQPSVQYHSTSSCTFFTSRLRYHCAFSRSCR